MPITALNPLEQKRQIDTFVDFFVKEFMSEVWYLEESARGNIEARKEADLTMLFNVACALVSLVPIPGSVIAFVASQKLIMAAIQLAKQISDPIDKSQMAALARQAASFAQEVYGVYSDNADNISTIRAGAGDYYEMGESGAVDPETLSVLARWLGYQIARRYEQALTERLSTQADQGIMGLARIGARRCLAYLGENPSPAGDPKTRTEHLLAGIMVGKSCKFYERPLKWFAKSEHLIGRAECASEKFTAERFYPNVAWISETAPGVLQCLASSGTEWFKGSLAGLPKYGYVEGSVPAEMKLVPYAGLTVDIGEWTHRRLYQSITLDQITAYLSSSEVLLAKSESRTSTMTLNQFLYATSLDTFPEGAQATFEGDLTSLDLSCGNFEGVDFSGSEMSGDLSHTSFAYAKLYATTFKTVTATALVNFAYAQMGFSDLSKATLQGEVNFTQADLTCADLTDAKFGSVQQLGTRWYKTKLDGVDYEAIRRAQQEQVGQIATEQARQKEQLQAVDARVAALEAQIQPLLERIQASMPVMAVGGAGGALTEVQQQLMDQQEQLAELLNAQVKRLEFEAYAEAKLETLSRDSEAHGEALARLGADLTTVRSESREAEGILQDQITQLDHRLTDLEGAVTILKRRASETRVTLETSQQRLGDLEGLLLSLQTQVQQRDMTPEEYEAYLEKTAIQKLLSQYTKTLSQKLQDLTYYVRSDVIDRIPDSMSSAEFVGKIEAGEIDKVPSPLLEEVDAYLNSSDEMLVLLGDPGSGKSLFSWYSTQSRLGHYQELLEGREPTGAPWLPVVIELKGHTLADLNDLLPRHLKEVCKLTPEEYVAIQNDTQAKHRMLLILDGFDELKRAEEGKSIEHIFADCFQACGGNAWFNGQLKIIVTCRLRHLKDEMTEDRYFGHGAYHAYRRRVLLPFSSDKIAVYLDERVANTSAASHLLPAAEYRQVIAESKTVKEMVRNPFVLRLFVDALPKLKTQGRDLKAIKRYDIYEAFVAQWFEREIVRFNPTNRAEIGVSEVGTAGVAQKFTQYAGLLAVQMYQHDSLIVSYDPHKRDAEAGRVWSRLDEIIAEDNLDETKLRDQLQIEYERLTTTEKRKLQIKEKISTAKAYVESKIQALLEKQVDVIDAQLKAFKIGSPLREAGTDYSFIHKSFYEFFLAHNILTIAGSEQALASRVAHTLQTLTAAPGHALRRIQQEPQVLLFIQDRWMGHASTPVILRIKETFFEVIERSKGHPEHGIAAANAITMLNWMQTMLIGKNWQHINIPGANLSYAVLRSSNLSYANLRGSKLFRADLTEVNLTRADLSGLQLDEKAPIDLSDPASCVVHHPTLPRIAVAVDKLIVQYDTETGKQYGPTLVGHADIVNSVCYSTDGSRLASGGEDGTICQWNSETGEPNGPVLRLEGYTNYVYSVCYSPNGAYLASASNDNMIRQWNVQTGLPHGCSVIKDLVGFGWHNICYSPDGSHLASASVHNKIYQWDAKTGESCGPVIEGHTDEITSVNYSPDSAYLVSGSRDKTIRQWDAKTGERHGRVLEGHTDIVYSVCYSPDGSRLVSGSRDATIRQWDAKTGEPYGPVLKGHVRAVSSVCYSPDGSLLISGGYDNTVRQWYASAGEFYGPVLKGHTGSVTSVSCSSDGNHLASASMDATILQWEVKTGESYGPVLEGNETDVNSVCYLPNGLRLASGGRDGTIRQWDTKTGSAYGPLLEALSIGGSTDGSGSASDSDDFFPAWETKEDQWGTKTGSKASSISGSTDESGLASESEDSLHPWETKMTKMEREAAVVRSVCYSQDGLYLAAGSEDLTIRQWNAETGEPYGEELEGHSGVVTSICYSPDGAYLVSASRDETIRQWDAKTGEPRGRVIEGHTDEVTSVNYSPDGAYLVSASRDKTIRQWDAKTGEPHGRVIEGHTDKVTSVNYSPDGSRLVSGSQDGTIRQWDAKTGELYDPVLEGHASGITSVCYSQNGHYLVSGSNDNNVCLWEVSLAQPKLIWKTRSASTPLMAKGLCLSGAFELKSDQKALLKYAGCETTDRVTAHPSEWGMDADELAVPNTPVASQIIPVAEVKPMPPEEAVASPVDSVMSFALTPSSLSAVQALTFNTRLLEICNGVAEPDLAELRALLAGGADPNASRETRHLKDICALQCAVKRGHMDVIRMLLQAGAKVDALDSYGRSPLMALLSRIHNKKKMMAPGTIRAITALLLESGANPMRTSVFWEDPVMLRLFGKGRGNHKGWNALHLAAYYHSDPALIILLRRYGSDVSLSTGVQCDAKLRNLTPRDLAIQQHHFEVIEALEQPLPPASVARGVTSSLQAEAAFYRAPSPTTKAADSMPKFE